jgi:hypothetical protein
MNDDLADRIAAVRRATPPTEGERDRARLLLADLLAAADRHGVTLADFDWVADLPGACIDVIRHHEVRNR